MKTKILFILFMLFGLSSLYPQSFNNFITITGSYDGHHIELTLATDKMRYLIGEPVQMMFQIKNIENQPIFISMSCINVFEWYIVKDSSQNWIWDHGLFGLPAVWGFSLAPNEIAADTAIMESNIINQPGTFTLTGGLGCYPQTYPVSLYLDFIFHEPLSITEIESDCRRESIIKNIYPNPTNSSTLIEFCLPSRDLVELTVYNIAGKQIRIIANQFYNAGEHTLKWDTGNIPSGMYIIKIKSDKFNGVQRLIITK